MAAAKLSANLAAGWFYVVQHLTVSSPYRIKKGVSVPGSARVRLRFISATHTRGCFDLSVKSSNSQVFFLALKFNNWFLSAVITFPTCIMVG